MNKLILLRHGQSQWNFENRFTGWKDVPLTEKGTKEAIDEIMQLGMAHPMGPLMLADLIGLDVCHDILQVLYTDLANDKYLPCPLLKQMILEGRLGRKTGHGFYQY